MKRPTRIDFLYLNPSDYCFKYFWPIFILALFLSYPLARSADNFLSTSVIFKDFYNSSPDFDTYGTIIAVYVLVNGLVYFFLYKLSKYIVLQKRADFKKHCDELEADASVDYGEYESCISALSLSFEAEHLRKEKKEREKREREARTDVQPGRRTSGFSIDCFSLDPIKFALKYRPSTIILIPIVGSILTAIYTFIYGFNGFAELIIHFIISSLLIMLALYIQTALQMEKEKEKHWELLRQIELLNIHLLVNGDMKNARTVARVLNTYLEAVI